MKTLERKTDSKQAEAVHLVADAAGILFEHWGYRAVVGRVWAVLLLSADPVDASSLRDALGISSGALSMALKDLVQLGLIYREATEGTRRFYYRAETDFWMIATHIFRERERKRFESVLDQIRQAEQILLADASASANDNDAAYRLEQVRRLAGMGEFVIGLLDAVMERTKVELKAAQKWLSVSGKIGGEPLSRIRRAINANRMERRRRT
ncbi:MAG: hypothetical protein GY854_03190 [Deltaproteobacteria bacterium]|nr:hypothetical protein [Deltaproteobacteria bacterium]